MAQRADPHRAALPLLHRHLQLHVLARRLRAVSDTTPSTGARMTANEHWSYQLVCPKCGKTGTADETELDGWPYMRAIERGNQYRWVRTSDGFKVVQPKNPMMADVVCAECG